MSKTSHKSHFYLIRNREIRVRWPFWLTFASLVAVHFSLSLSHFGLPLLANTFYDCHLWSRSMTQPTILIKHIWNSTHASIHCMIAFDSIKICWQCSIRHDVFEGKQKLCWSNFMHLEHIQSYSSRSVIFLRNYSQPYQKFITTLFSLFHRRRECFHLLSIWNVLLHQRKMKILKKKKKENKHKRDIRSLTERLNM